MEDMRLTELEYQLLIRFNEVRGIYAYAELNRYFDKPQYANLNIEETLQAALDNLILYYQVQHLTVKSIRCALMGISQCMMKWLEEN
jgi:hypothetical protein